MNIRIASIAAHQTWSLRHRIMWPHKSIDYVKVPEDENGLHYGLYKDNNIVSVVSLFITTPCSDRSSNNDSIAEAQFRKFCTETSEQGNGYGSMLLQHMFDELRKQEYSPQQENVVVDRVWCNARIDKTGFYKKFNMKETNETFERGGQEYVIMETQLLQPSNDDSNNGKKNEELN